jgi:hypothetical protein
MAAARKTGWPMKRLQRRRAALAFIAALALADALAALWLWQAWQERHGDEADAVQRTILGPRARP